MLNHFLKIFFRSSIKNATYSFINITGLAFGLAGSILILLWVIDEISFDNFHQDKDRIYQIMRNHTFPDGIDTQFGQIGIFHASGKPGDIGEGEGDVVHAGNDGASWYDASGKAIWGRDASAPSRSSAVA